MRRQRRSLGVIIGGLKGISRGVKETGIFLRRRLEFSLSEIQWRYQALIGSHHHVL